ncbi:MAG: sulfotransferase [Steroidobacteraceae bacterium]
MLLNWFNARDATQAGATLADCYLPESAPSAAPRRKEQPPKNGRADLKKFLQRVAREAGPLKLNLFKRAKLLNSFKWRLLERGVDRKTADELTELVLLQLSSDPFGAVSSGAVATAPVKGGHSRRVPALLAEADTYFADRNHREAAARYQEALQIDSRNAVAHVKLGASLCHLGQYREGEQEFRHAIKIKAACPGAQLNLGILLRVKGEFAASELALRSAVKQDPRDPQALVDLGVTLGLLGDLAGAKECFEKALRLKSQHADALCGLGRLARDEGRFEEAERLYRTALDIEPLSVDAWASIAALRRMTSADTDWIEGVEKALASGVQPLEEAKLRFAMGKYFDDLGKYPRAFTEYKRGNELYKLVAMPYNRSARTAFVDDMLRVYSQECLARPPEGACESRTPVFVVGMPRSGTSLVEQIIASHPNAAAAGEVDFWNSAAYRKYTSLRREAPDARLTKKLADSYLSVLTRNSGQALRVVDKAPFNSDLLGLIHRVLPNVRVIYMRRDPIDTCLSCYFQDFANLAPFTLDLSDLAHQYREHHRLMSHWRSALPAGMLLEVPYAELVADQETWSRKVIEFIGLEWDPRCLEFHKTERPVLTASNWQVRQRIYTSAVERWKNYQKFIGPLLELRNLRT